jgi:hypothetical protein
MVGRMPSSSRSGLLHLSLRLSRVAWEALPLRTAARMSTNSLSACAAREKLMTSANDP